MRPIYRLSETAVYCNPRKNLVSLGSTGIKRRRRNWIRLKASQA
jgi:hypothetical protein